VHFPKKGKGLLAWRWDVQLAWDCVLGAAAGALEGWLEAEVLPLEGMLAAGGTAKVGPGAPPSGSSPKNSAGLLRSHSVALATVLRTLWTRALGPKAAEQGASHVASSSAALQLGQMQACRGWPELLLFMQTMTKGAGELEASATALMLTAAVDWSSSVSWVQACRGLWVTCPVPGRAATLRGMLAVGDAGMMRGGLIVKGLLVSREKVERELEGPVLTAEKVLAAGEASKDRRWLGGRVLRWLLELGGALRLARWGLVIEDMVLERERDEELAFGELLIAGKVRLFKRQSR